MENAIIKTQHTPEERLKTEADKRACQLLHAGRTTYKEGTSAWRKYIEDELAKIKDPLHSLVRERLNVRRKK